MQDYWGEPFLLFVAYIKEKPASQSSTAGDFLSVEIDPGAPIGRRAVLGKIIKFLHFAVPFKNWLSKHRVLAPTMQQSVRGYVFGIRVISNFRKEHNYRAGLGAIGIARNRL